MQAVQPVGLRPLLKAYPEVLVQGLEPVRVSLRLQVQVQVSALEPVSLLRRVPVLV
jgi:hypothetical protein